MAVVSRPGRGRGPGVLRCGGAEEGLQAEGGIRAFVGSEGGKILWLWLWGSAAFMHI